MKSFTVGIDGSVPDGKVLFILEDATMDDILAAIKIENGHRSSYETEIMSFTVGETIMKGKGVKV